jgi:tetratricopeptide (TPR) repeat protein
MKSVVLVSMCVAASCALLCPPSVALAQPGGTPSASADAHAKEAFKKGEALFRAGRYLEALAQFSGGYELSQRPLFLFNMGECARKLGQTERARAYYERYIAADKGGKLVALAAKRVAELGGKPATNDEPAKKAPVAGATAPATGEATAPGTAPEAAAPGPGGASRAARSPAVATPSAAEPPAQSVPAAALQADAPQEQESRPLWKKWPFWAAVGAAAVTATAVVIATSSGGDGGCTGTCVDFR